jgi:Rrf2 family cysteine metabolism transcriptional repressor
MKFSTKSRYGLRAVLDIAIHGENGPITINNIADRQDISERYLEQLMTSLKNSGFVKSVRGAQGGYILSKEPKDIKVGDIIRALDGPITPVACVGEEYTDDCTRKEACATRLIWNEVKKSIDVVLDKYTIEDLINETKRLSGSQNFMYYI